MNDTEIPPEEWGDFCQRYGVGHRGWLVTVRVREGDDDVVLATERPLRELRLASAGGSAELTLTVGRGPDERSLRLGDVVRLYRRMADGVDAGLRIDTVGDESAVLHFRAAAEPDGAERPRTEAASGPGRRW